MIKTMICALAAACSVYGLWGLTEIIYWERLRVQFRGPTQKKRAEEMWPATLLLLAGLLKAGLSHADALDILRKEAPEPIRQKFNERLTGVADWLPLHQRIERLFCEDYLTLPKAILLLSHQSGGKSAILLETAAELLAKRLELRQKVQVLTAEGRLSAWVVSASPFALLLLLASIAPDFVRPLFVLQKGRMLLVLMGMMVVMGLVFVHRAVRLEP